MKKSYIVASVITLLLLAPLVYIVAVAWRAKPHSADERLKRQNPELDYSTYYYRLLLGKSSEPFQNLSGSGSEEAAGYGRFAAGWEILHDTDELAALDETIEAARETQPELFYDSAGPTASTYDADFFAAHDLLLVDLCVEGSIEMYFYPENLKIDGEAVSLKVRWDCDNADTADCAGQYCLITIPKGCTTAEVDLRK